MATYLQKTGFKIMFYPTSENSAFPLFAGKFNPLSCGGFVYTPDEGTFLSHEETMILYKVQFKSDKYTSETRLRYAQGVKPLFTGVLSFNLDRITNKPLNELTKAQANSKAYLMRTLAMVYDMAQNIPDLYGSDFLDNEAITEVNEGVNDLYAFLDKKMAIIADL